MLHVTLWAAADTGASLGVLVPTAAESWGQTWGPAGLVDQTPVVPRVCQDRLAQPDNPWTESTQTNP
jgi:hypothetical protein